MTSPATHSFKKLTEHAALACLTLTLLISLAGCGGAQTQTEATMFSWAQILNTHLATSAGNAFPKKGLSEIDPVLTQGLPVTDGWDQTFHYRRLRDDRYQLISAGPDGEFGNEDDVIVENGKLMVTEKAYKKKPLKK